MTLLVTVFAAVISTVIWYSKAPDNGLRIGLLCWLFWGASIMWLVDAIFEYRELGAAYFSPAPAEMAGDLFLGLAVIAFALIIWLVYLLIRDPKGVVKKALFHKK